MTRKELLTAPGPAEEVRLTAPRTWASAASSPIMAVALALLLGVALFWPSWAALARLWMDSESRYSHGFLLLAAAFVLMARNLPPRVDLRATPRSAVAFVALAGASLLWLVAHRAALVTVEQVFALGALLALVYSVFGHRVGTVAAMPLALLALALPIWDVAMDSFQRATIAAVHALATLVRLPARFDGAYVHLDAGVFEIAPTCNGLQLFLAACATGGLLAVQRAERLPFAACVVCAAGIVGLLANWLRVFVVVVAGHLSDMQHYLVTSEHYTLGWTFFAVGMLLFAWRLGRRPVRAMQLPAVEEAAGRKGLAGALGAAALCLALGPILAWTAAAAADGPGTISIASWQLPTWSARAAAPEWRPTLVGAAAEGSGVFGRIGGPERATVHVARFTHIENGRELAGAQNALWPRDWTVVESPARGPVPSDAAGPVTFHVVRDFADRSWAIAVRYQSGSRLYASALRAQLDFAVAGLFGATAACGIVVAALPCDGDCGPAGERLASFLAEARQPLTAAIATGNP